MPQNVRIAAYKSGSSEACLPSAVLTGSLTNHSYAGSSHSGTNPNTETASIPISSRTPTYQPMQMSPEIVSFSTRDVSSLSAGMKSLHLDKHSHSVSGNVRNSFAKPRSYIEGSGRNTPTFVPSSLASSGMPSGVPPQYLSRSSSPLIHPSTPIRSSSTSSAYTIQTAHTDSPMGNLPGKLRHTQSTLASSSSSSSSSASPDTLDFSRSGSLLADCTALLSFLQTHAKPAFDVPSPTHTSLPQHTHTKSGTVPSLAAPLASLLPGGHVATPLAHGSVGAGHGVGCSVDAALDAERRAWVQDMFSSDYSVLRHTYDAENGPIGGDRDLAMAESIHALVSEEFSRPMLLSALVSRLTLLRDALLTERAQRRTLESDLKTLSSYSAGLRDAAERAKDRVKELGEANGRLKYKLSCVVSEDGGLWDDGHDERDGADGDGGGGSGRGTGARRSARGVRGSDEHILSLLGAEVRDKHGDKALLPLSKVLALHREVEAVKEEYARVVRVSEGAAAKAESERVVWKMEMDAMSTATRNAEQEKMEIFRENVELREKIRVLELELHQLREEKHSTRANATGKHDFPNSTYNSQVDGVASFAHPHHSSASPRPPAGTTATPGAATPAPVRPSNAVTNIVRALGIQPGAQVEVEMSGRAGDRRACAVLSQAAVNTSVGIQTTFRDIVDGNFCTSPETLINAESVVSEASQKREIAPEAGSQHKHFMSNAAAKARHDPPAHATSTSTGTGMDAGRSEGDNEASASPPGVLLPWRHVVERVATTVQVLHSAYITLLTSGFNASQSGVRDTRSENPFSILLSLLAQLPCGARAALSSLAHLPGDAPNSSSTGTSSPSLSQHITPPLLALLLCCTALATQDSHLSYLSSFASHSLVATATLASTLRDTRRAARAATGAAGRAGREVLRLREHMEAFDIVLRRWVVQGRVRGDEDDVVDEAWRGCVGEWCDDGYGDGWEEEAEEKVEREGVCVVRLCKNATCNVVSLDLKGMGRQWRKDVRHVKIRPHAADELHIVLLDGPTKASSEDNFVNYDKLVTLNKKKRGEWESTHSLAVWVQSLSLQCRDGEERDQLLIFFTEVRQRAMEESEE